ncbi:hypothetical protein ACFP1I_32515 [Dyadobacter subterraneus]|uniref:Uncharacterized protein n=1 Tax=Dyadobacter subterraneus TaxID=2773304 RepID=A0ABR9WHC2_9BACT|nr:hypothetical protein [Dyadobacter subterraneus]MBE9463746.1 hypothetical protein [Dyadobacter subterraneus]
MRFNCLSLAFAILFMLSNCKKESDVLPDETQNGSNTFGCKVNGEIWLPKSSFGKPGIDLSYDPAFNGGTMSLKARNWFYTNKQQTISTASNINIAIGQLSKTGKYSFDSDIGQALGQYYIATLEDQSATEIMNCYYDEVGDKRTGTLTISKLDLQNGFISGTFDFILNKKDSLAGCKPVIKVTEGRFDVKF